MLDPSPPRRAGRSPRSDSRGAPRRRVTSCPRSWPTERGAVHAAEALALTGSGAGVPQAGDFLLRDGLLARVGPALVEHVAAFHDEHPLDEGEPLAAARRALTEHLRPRWARRMLG